jgi:hypothetical protein
VCLFKPKSDSISLTKILPKSWRMKDRGLWSTSSLHSCPVLHQIHLMAFLSFLTLLSCDGLLASASLDSASKLLSLQLSMCNSCYIH